jgi:hypothetical protein
MRAGGNGALQAAICLYIGGDIDLDLAAGEGRVREVGHPVRLDAPCPAQVGMLLGGSQRR